MNFKKIVGIGTGHYRRGEDGALWWVYIHVNSNVQPEKQLVNYVNVHCFYVVIFFLVKLNMPI